MEQLLVDFLRGGKLGELKTGMPLLDALAYMGIPYGRYPDNSDEDRRAFATELHQEAISKEKHEFGFLYGSLELRFLTETQALYAISIGSPWDLDILPEIFLPTGISEEWKSPDIPKILELIRLADVECLRVFSNNPDLNAICTVLWVPTSLTQIGFDLEDNQWKLAMIEQYDYGFNPCANRLCKKVV